MEKDLRKKKVVDYAKDIVVSILGGYVVTFLGILILALLLFMFQISENTVNIVIIAIYISSCFLTGIVVGKRIGTRKFLWGMMSGFFYYMLLFGFSVYLDKNIGNNALNVFLICTGSSTLGGMVS